MIFYYAPRQKEDAYGAPVNLGDVINTAGDDLSPYYRDGKLYFSSDGRTGMGALIFSRRSGTEVPGQSQKIWVTGLIQPPMT